MLIGGGGRVAVFGRGDSLGRRMAVRPLGCRYARHGYPLAVMRFRVGPGKLRFRVDPRV